MKDCSIDSEKELTPEKIYKSRNFQRVVWESLQSPRPFQRAHYIKAIFIILTYYLHFVLSLSHKYTLALFKGNLT